MTPPKDPAINALFRVRHIDGLCQLEQLALWTMWRLNGHEWRTIGPQLLAYLLNTKYGNAKKILTRLRDLGYITSRPSKGRIHERRITRKAKLPKRKLTGVPQGYSKGMPQGSLTYSQTSSPSSDLRASEGCHIEEQANQLQPLKPVKRQKPKTVENWLQADIRAQVKAGAA